MYKWKLMHMLLEGANDAQTSRNLKRLDKKN